MQDSNEITIKVGFDGKYREIKVQIPEGDIPPYQPSEALKVVGQRKSRLDGEAKVTGRARYTYDQHPPGMLYGKILRSPHPNADIKSIDLAPALKMPGVKAAVSYPDFWDTLTSLADTV